MNLLHEIDLSQITPTRLLLLLLLFIVCDVITGCIKAIFEGKLDSGKMRQGIIKKAIEIGVIVVVLVMDGILFGEAKSIFLFISIFLIDEGISILENTADYLPWPKGLLHALKSVKENKVEKGEE